MSEPKDPKLSALVRRLRPETMSGSLEQNVKTAESVTGVRYIFNPAYPIKNLDGGGFKHGVHLVQIPRMELVPITVYRNPDIQVRAGGFTVGALTRAGAFPSGSVGSKVDYVLQYPKTSVDRLLSKYGRYGNQAIGLTELASLVADDDDSKGEAELIWRAVMEDQRNASGLAGTAICLEDLPQFLSEIAPLLLSKAIEDGVRIYYGNDPNGLVYRLPHTAMSKGEKMISDIIGAVEDARVYALDERQGVLPKTARELIASNKGQAENKVMMDGRDHFFAKQFPSYQMPSDSSNIQQRRAAPDSATSQAAIAQSADSNEITREALNMLKEAQKQLSEMNERNAELTAKVLAMQPPVDQTASPAS